MSTLEEQDIAPSTTERELLEKRPTAIEIVIFLLCLLHLDGREEVDAKHERAV